MANKIGRVPVREQDPKVRAGKIISAEIRSAPISLIPSTIVTATRSAERILKPSALCPAARQKFSSNVTANILL